jgi:hypothetical protein
MKACYVVFSLLGISALTCALPPHSTLSVVYAQPATGAAPSAYPRKFGYVAMKDGVRLAYVAYLPSVSGQFPSVLRYEPYQGGGADSDGHWLKKGYAVVTVSVRGTGCSQGVFDLFGPHEGPDGAEVVDWISQQPWSDQKVGMIGASYPGHTQILTAAQQPKALKAITPAAITSNTYDDLAYPGGIFNVTMIARWSLIIQPTLAATGARQRIGWGDEECQANMSGHPAPSLVEQTREHPFFDGFWKERSLETYIDHVKVPTLISGDWQDNVTQASGGTTLYEKLNAPKRLIYSTGGHAGVYGVPSYQGELDRWIDRWVLGKEDGIEAEPAVTVYWEPGAGGKPNATWTRHYDDWPVKKARTRTFYLTGDGRLSDEPAGGSGPAAAPRNYIYPTGVELVADNAQFSLPVNPSGLLTWTSAAFGDDVTILGSTEICFYFSSENIDTDFVVALHDIYPDGDVQYLQRGFLRASLRRVDEAKSTPDHLWRPYNKPEPLTQGHIYKVRLSLPPVGAVLRKGHKLQVALLAPSEVGTPDWGPSPINMPGRNTVYASAKYPSEIRVPVIPDVKAQGPEPLCGSLMFQPCRKAGALDSTLRSVLGN